MAINDRDLDQNSDLASRLFDALRSPMRRQILCSLMAGPASAKTLSHAYGVPVGNVSYHLARVLYKTYDLVEIVETIQRRGAEETIYGLRREAYIENIKWLEVPANLRSAVHGIGLDTFMASAIASLEAESDKPERAQIFSFQPLGIDEAGHREIVAAVQNLQATIDSVAKRCSALRPSERRQLIVGTAVFDTAPRSLRGA